MISLFSILYLPGCADDGGGGYLAHLREKEALLRRDSERSSWEKDLYVKYADEALKAGSKAESVKARQLADAADKASRKTAQEADEVRADIKRRIPEGHPDETESLRDANLVYNAPDSMRLRETVSIKIRLSPTVSIKQLQRELTEPGKKESAKIQVSQLVEAHVVGSEGLRVLPISGADHPQVVDSQTVNEWQWEVKAIAGGKQQLHVIIDSLVFIEKQSVTKRVNSFDKYIDVDISLNDWLLEHVSGIWLLGLSLPFATALVAVITILLTKKARHTWRRVSSPNRQIHTMRSPPVTPVKIFYSYSHEDKSLRDELAKHLSLLKRQGIITEWHDRRIGAGEEWKGAIDKNLEKADIILLLVSASFMASDYCWDVETKRALERHDRGDAKVIPVILRQCDWHGAPFGKLQALPNHGRPVTSWSNRDEPFALVAAGIRLVVEAMKGKG